MSKKRKTHEEFINELKNLNDNIEVLEQYNGCDTKILCRCKLDGYEWTSSPSNLLSNHGCPKCGGVARKTHEEFVTEVSNINKNISVIGKYKNAHTKILCKCKVCNNEWYAKPHMLINKINPTGCPSCANLIVAQKCSKTHSEFIEELNHVNKNIKILTKYKNNHTKVSCKCMICQYEWDARPADLIKNNPNGCPKCGNSLKKIHNDFISELHNINKDIKILGNYKNNKSKILCKCKLCGYEWMETPNSLLRSSRQKGCIICNHLNSYGEERIGNFLLKNGIKFICQKTFDDLIGVNSGKLSYDFYIPDYNILIEYQGQQHYKPTTFGGISINKAEKMLKQQLEHDRRKRDYAQSHNITLIEINYYDFNNVENILTKYLYNKSA